VTVAITYLHHTHPDIPYHTEETWTFTKGAMGTVDRSCMGLTGRHFFHEIVDYHAVHHLFPKIPFYHAERATHAIRPLMGDRYMEAKNESFLGSLYSTFKSCNYVAERRDEKTQARTGQLFWVLKRE
jgi:bifunctional Delta-12/omega-3 fatty acid desaturase